MSLSREKFESLGGAFSVEGERHQADIDQEYSVAHLTLNDRTVNFQGKSEEDVLAQAERVLLANQVDINEQEPDEA